MKTTIPEVIEIVIFEFLASRAFKRVPTLWGYLYFSIFYDFKIIKFKKLIKMKINIPDTVFDF